METKSAVRIEALENRIAPAMIYAVDTSNHLISFDSATPAAVVSKNITGLAVPATETIRGIDFRPATGELYALGINNPDAGNDEGRVYTLNTTTGVLTQVGATPFKTDFADGNDYSFDVNPSVDRLRITTDRDDNLRVNPNTGALAGSDTDLTAGANPAVVGTAYDRNFEGTPLTTLYGIDNTTDSLVRIGGIDGTPSPNGGVVTSIGALGVAFTDFKVGFDIESRTGTAYAVIRPSGTNLTTLFTINLANGAATAVGTIGGNPDLHGMSVALPNDLTIVNATTAKYIDQDGDAVMVKVTGAPVGATLSPGDFTFSSGQFGSQLKLLDLSAASNNQEWAHASITITAVPVKTGLVVRGDSFANVGYINATGVDLGKVSVNGDLGQIDAGDATTSTMGLAGLTAQSMGVVSNSQLPTGNVPDQTSNIVGKLGSLLVKGDLTRELVTVTGGVTDGAIGPITIGGDLVGTGASVVSGISSTGPMGNIIVRGDIFGGAASGVGSILAGTNIGTVSLFGSLYGGSAPNTGIIEGTNVGNVVIKGSIFGGTDDHTGDIHARGILGNVTITGSIVGGTLTVNGDIDSGIVYSTGSKVGNVTVLGGLEGSNGGFSGSLFSNGTMGNVIIGGSVKGGSTGDSGSIEVSGNLGTVKIGGDLIGGTGNYSGSIETFSTGSIASVTVLGNVIGNSTSINGIISTNQIGAVKILGSLQSTSVGGVRISAEGDTAVTKTAKTAGAIASINITGSVRNALILGGYSVGGSATNPDATIGPVTVGQNWIASQLIVGVTNLGVNHAPGGGDDNINFGNADDAKITSVNDAAALISKIASVTIKGYALGTVGGSDSFGIVAEQIGVVKVGLRPYALAAGTDLVGLSLGATVDFLVHEV